MTFTKGWHSPENERYKIDKMLKNDSYSFRLLNTMNKYNYSKHDLDNSEY